MIQTAQHADPVPKHAVPVPKLAGPFQTNAQPLLKHDESTAYTATWSQRQAEPILISYRAHANRI